MLRNVVEPILGSANDFQHISILRGTKVYGVHLHPIPPSRRGKAICVARSLLPVRHPVHNRGYRPDRRRSQTPAVRRRRPH
jgi:hypothetical protein